MSEINTMMFELTLTIVALTIAVTALFLVASIQPPGELGAKEITVAPYPTPTINVLTFGRTHSLDTNTSILRMEHAENSMKKLSEK